MAERIVIQLATVAAPAKAAPLRIENHSRHWDFSPVTGAAGLAQQPLHPKALLRGRNGRGVQHSAAAAGWGTQRASASMLRDGKGE